MKKNLFISVLILNILLTLINILFVILYLHLYLVGDSNEYISLKWTIFNNVFMVVYFILFICEFIYKRVFIKEKKELRKRVNILLILSSVGFFFCILCMSVGKKYDDAPLIMYLLSPLLS